MTIDILLNQLQRMRPGQVREEDVLLSVNKLEAKIFKELIETHENPVCFHLPVYDNADITAKTHLLAEDGYDDVYLWWCCMETDLLYGDFNRYDASLARFAECWEDLAARYTRTHMPKQASQAGTVKQSHSVLGVLL